MCSTANVDFVRWLGADDVINYSTQDLSATDRRFDLIFQLGGTAGASSLRVVLKEDGTLVLRSGDSPGRIIGPFGRIIRAMLLSILVSQHIRMLEFESAADDLMTLKGSIEAEAVHPAEGFRYPLKEATEALRRLESGATRGKVVVSVLGERPV